MYSFTGLLLAKYPVFPIMAFVFTLSPYPHALCMSLFVSFWFQSMVFVLWEYIAHHNAVESSMIFPVDTSLTPIFAVLFFSLAFQFQNLKMEKDSRKQIRMNLLTYTKVNMTNDLNICYSSVILSSLQQFW